MPNKQQQPESYGINPLMAYERLKLVVDAAVPLVVNALGAEITQESPAANYDQVNSAPVVPPSNMEAFNALMQKTLEETPNEA